MSAISLKSITGITSITTPAGVDNQLTLHNNNTSETVKIDIAGNVHINNQLAVTGVTTFSDDVTFTGASNNIVFDKSSNHIKFNDGAQIKLGTSNDASIRHDGFNTWIQNSTGYLYLDASSTGIRLISQASWASGAMAAFNNNGSVQLYYDASQKFYTTASGINVIGTTDTDGLVVSGVSTFNADNANGYLAEFNQTNASNDARILINSPADNNIRPSYIQLSNAGTAKWCIGQVYASTSSDAFHLLRGDGQESNSKLVVTTAGRIGIGTINPLGKVGIVVNDQVSDADIVFQTKSGDSLAHGSLSTTDDSGGTDLMLGSNLYLGLNGTLSRYTTGRSGSGVRVGYSGIIRCYTNSGNNAPIERLRINSDGNVGIGTNTLDSSANLSITDTGSARIYLKSGNTSDTSIYFGRLNDSATAAIRYEHSTDAFDFYGYNNSKRMTIDSIGRILIGSQRTFGNATYYDDITVNNSNNTSGASGGTGLTLISGTSSWNAVIFGDTPTDVQNAGWIKYTHGGDAMLFATGGTERIRIDSNGDINLGSNPTNQYGYKLNIQDSAIIYAQTASSGGLEAKWHLDNSAQLMELGTVTTDDLALVTNNVSRLRITSDGTTISTISSPDPYNTVKENIRIVNSAGNQGAGSKIRFATANANAHIESRITGNNSNSGTSLNFATSPANSDAEECLRITPSGNILQRSRPYSNTHQNPGWGMGRYVKSGWLMAQSSFSNPVMDLVDLLDQGNAYQNIFFKVTAMQIRFRGHNNPEGQIHTGYASAKRDPSGTNTWYAYVGTMVLENAASGFNSGSNVGTLSWSASNNFDTATLRYTGNRQDNYDTYQVCVEVWSNNNDSLGFKLSSGYLA